MNRIITLGDVLLMFACIIIIDVFLFPKSLTTDVMSFIGQFAGLVIMSKKA